MAFRGGFFMSGKKLNLPVIAKGILFAIIFTFILILVIAAVCYFAVVPDKLLSVLVFAATGISVLFSSIAMSKNISGAGLLNGGVLGMGYFVVMLLANIIVNAGFEFNLKLVSMMICALSCGMLGGILGINAKK